MVSRLGRHDRDVLSRRPYWLYILIYVRMFFLYIRRIENFSIKTFVYCYSNSLRDTIMTKPWTKGLVLICACYAVASTAQDKPIIYGLEQAAELNDSVDSGGYIQAASFQEKYKADQYQQQLQSLTSYPVTVSYKSHFYAVLIGPMNTAEQRRNAALSILDKQQSTSLSSSPRLFSAPAAEQDHQDYNPPEPSYRNLSLPTSSFSQWYGSLGVGEQFAQFTKNIQINNGSGFIQPFSNDIYTTNQPSSTLVTAALGRRWERNSEWIPAYSLGVSYQYFSSSTIKGTITQYSDPLFTNYNYQASVSSNMILASGKLNLYTFNRFSPYVTLGIGGAYNHFDKYQETALPDVTPRVSPHFGSNNTSQFAYNAGAGIDIRISQPLILTLSYLYQNLGNVTSGLGAQTWSGSSLNFGTFSSNEMVISVSYLF